MSGLARRSAALVGPLEGSRVTSKGLGGAAQEEGERPGPLAVAGVAVRCCRRQGRPPCQPASGYVATNSLAPCLDTTSSSVLT